LMAIVSSGVSVTALAGLRSHLLTNMRLACFSGLGLRKGALAASLPLRRGTRLAGSRRAARRRGGVCRRLSYSGSSRELMKRAPTSMSSVAATAASTGAGSWALPTPARDECISSPTTTSGGLGRSGVLYESSCASAATRVGSTDSMGATTSKSG
jgi:hypothetical protein